MVADTSGHHDLVGINQEFGSAEWLYDTLYCERGQAGNVIKLHTSHVLQSVRQVQIQETQSTIPSSDGTNLTRHSVVAGTCYSPCLTSKSALSSDPSNAHEINVLSRRSTSGDAPGSSGHPRSIHIP